MSQHDRQIALMKFLSKFARDLGVGRDVYVVGGAVRSFAMGLPIKDLDIVVDSVSLGHGRDSEWFAKKLADAIPARTHLVTNQYGVAILSVKGEWVLDGIDLEGEVIEVANARKESYAGTGGKGKGYKPTDVVPATIMDDVTRRDFGFNTLLWRLHDLVQGPDYAEIVDLTGVGKAQLENRLLSTPLDPDKTFSDDPTRMLRVIKFLLRFPLEIVPEVESSIRRNAHRLKDMPWEAVGNILVGDILKSAKATTGIRVMKSLGILDVLVEMIQETPPFAAFLTKQLANGNHSVELLLELADLGIAGRVLSFLTTEQRARFKELSQGMDGDESRRFLEVLRVPPVDNAALIQEFTLEGRDRGLLVPIAREAILLDPSLATHEVRLNDRVRESLRATRGQGKTADLNPPLGVAGGPCKVVDRILQNVRNPRLRENLTEGAETGALSNSEARKVYPIATTESGSGFKSFSITPHAQYRMDFRSITVKDVEAALNSFIKWLMGVKDTSPSWYEDTLNQTEIAWIDPKTRLKVVFGLDGGNVQIITVFWKGEQDPAPTHCEVSAMARQASPLQPVTDKTLQDEVKGLEALASEIQAVVDTFLETVPMPHVGRIAAIQLRSQTECFTKCEHAARHAQRVVNKAFTILQTQPGNATATAVVRDAGMLLEKFDTYRVKSREMLSAMAQKIMPMALKTIVTYTLDGVRAELYEPNRVSVTVFPHYVPTKVGDSMVDGMVFDAYLTVFPNPVDVAAGLPKYQQFVLTQSTIGDTNVYLMAIDRTNVLDPTKPAEVGAPGAVSKILGYLKGWDNLLSVHTTKMAARARKRLTREQVEAMGAAAINKWMDVLDKESSGLMDEFIAAGRGRERLQEIVRMTDPLAVRYIQNWEDSSLLRDEIARRYGPGAPSRLPRGFGPIKKMAAGITDPQVLIEKGMDWMGAFWLKAIKSSGVDIGFTGTRAAGRPWMFTDYKTGKAVTVQLKVMGDVLVGHLDGSAMGYGKLTPGSNWDRVLAKVAKDTAMEVLKAVIQPNIDRLKAAPSRTVLTRPDVVKFLVTELKKIPGVKVKSTKNSIILVPGALNPLVKGIEILNLDHENAPFRMTLNNGMVGWGWDGYRKTGPVFHDAHNTLKLGVVFDGKRDPAVELRAFIKNVLLIGIEKAGMVWNGTALVPMPMGKAPAPAKTPVAPPPPAPKVDYLAAVTSALKGMRLGPVGGRILSVDYYPGASPSWSVEPANRERLDHYVGSGYRDRDGDDDDDDGDSDGWDSEAWEQDYADPVSTAAYKWLAAEFGPSLFYVEVGEKGHIDIQLTAEGRKKFLP